MTPQPDSSYSIAPLKRFMPGLWEVGFQIETATAKDSVMFVFCVEG
ncbi:hypothetical protein WMF04_30975 [Sorangium sp. So ce260]